MLQPLSLAVARLVEDKVLLLAEGGVERVVGCLGFKVALALYARCVDRVAFDMNVRLVTFGKRQIKWALVGEVFVAL